MPNARYLPTLARSPPKVNTYKGFREEMCLREWASYARPPEGLGSLSVLARA